jgi:hypothetical protein
MIYLIENGGSPGDIVCSIARLVKINHTCIQREYKPELWHFESIVFHDNKNI